MDAPLAAGSAMCTELSRKVDRALGRVGAGQARQSAQSEVPHRQYMPRQLGWCPVLRGRCVVGCAPMAAATAHTPIPTPRINPSKVARSCESTRRSASGRMRSPESGKALPMPSPVLVAGAHASRVALVAVWVCAHGREGGIAPATTITRSARPCVRREPLGAWGCAASQITASRGTEEVLVVGPTHAAVGVWWAEAAREQLGDPPSVWRLGGPRPRRAWGPPRHCGWGRCMRGGAWRRAAIRRVSPCMRCGWAVGRRQARCGGRVPCGARRVDAHIGWLVGHAASIPSLSTATRDGH